MNKYFAGFALALAAALAVPTGILGQALKKPKGNTVQGVTRGEAEAAQESGLAPTKPGAGKNTGNGTSTAGQGKAATPAKAAAPAKATVGRIAFSEYDLPNGLHVILHRDNSVPVVAVTVMYHVGSKNEQPDRTGFAHFFEHLLFEGSDNIKRGEYMRTIKGAGGNLNANTTADRTFYYEVLPSNQLELALYMESERMLHSKIDKVGVETQREVVKEEKRLRYDNRPYGSTFERLFGTAYQVHPYKVTTIGKMEHLNAATLDEFVKFYHDFYVPENAILSIAGDITEAQAKTLIAKYFGEVTRGGKAIYRPTIKEPVQTAERRDTVYDNITLPAVIQAYHTPPQSSPDYYALSLLATYLTGGESARMTKDLVNRRQLAVDVAAFPYPSEDPGIFFLRGICAQGHSAEELERGINQGIDSLKTELISEREFQKTINQAEAEFVRQNSSVAGIAENLAQYKMYLGDANLINTEIEKYRAVTREDIRRCARQYFTKENRTTLYYLPKKEN